MRAHLVEVFAPGFDDALGLGARPEPLHAQALVGEFAVEALQRAVLPRLAGIDQGGLDALIDDPLQQRPRDELRAVVGTQVERRTALTDQPRQHVDHAARADAAVDLDRQALEAANDVLEELKAGKIVGRVVLRP